MAILFDKVPDEYYCKFERLGSAAMWLYNYYGIRYWRGNSAWLGGHYSSPRLETATDRPAEWERKP